MLHHYIVLHVPQQTFALNDTKYQQFSVQLHQFTASATSIDAIEATRNFKAPSSRLPNTSTAVTNQNGRKPSENFHSNQSSNRHFLNLEAQENCRERSDDQLFYQNCLTTHGSRDDRSLFPRTTKSMPERDPTTSDTEDVPKDTADAFVFLFTLPNYDGVPRAPLAISLTHEKDSCDELAAEFPPTISTAGSALLTLQESKLPPKLQHDHLTGMCSGVNPRYNGYLRLNVID